MSAWPGDAREEKTTFGCLSRNALMARIRSHGNRTTERRFAELLRQSGITGWRRQQPILGHPDFTWPAAKIVVFVDGCFWHGHTCGKNIAPRTNARAWKQKIERNKRRDLTVARTLRSRSWTVNLGVSAG